MKFFTSVTDNVKSKWGSFKTTASYVVTAIKVKFNDPVFRQEVKTTLQDTIINLPGNLLQGVRGFLQILHAPSAIMRAIESQRIRQAAMASVRDNMLYAMEVVALANLLRLMPFVEEDTQQYMLFVISSPLKTDLIIKNILHATNISKAFSEEIPNNKNFEPCEDGSGAQASADIESVFRFVSELIFAGGIRFVPFVGHMIGFLLEALANAQYMIELKLSMVGMCSAHRREIFVNNSAYAIGFSLGLLLSASYISAELKKIPGLKTDALDGVVLVLLTQLFSMVAFLQHGPFTKKHKGQDLLSRDYFLLNHQLMDFILRETIDLFLPRLEDPAYRARQVSNIKSVIRYAKIPAAIFTDQKLYFIDRWLEIPSLKLLLKLYEKDFNRFLDPIGDAKIQMKRLPEWIVKQLPNMSNILAYVFYVLWNVNITDKQLEMVLSLLNDPVVSEKMLKIKYLLNKVNPKTEQDSEIASKPLLMANGVVIEDNILGTLPPRLSETEDGAFVSAETTQILDGQVSIGMNNSARFDQWRPPMVETTDGEFQESVPETRLDPDETRQSPIGDFYLNARPAVKDPDADNSTVDSAEWRVVYPAEGMPVPRTSRSAMSLLRLKNLFPAGNGNTTTVDQASQHGRDLRRSPSPAK